MGGGNECAEVEVRLRQRQVQEERRGHAQGLVMIGVVFLMSDVLSIMKSLHNQIKVYAILAPPVA